MFLSHGFPTIILFSLSVIVTSLLMTSSSWSLNAQELLACATTTTCPCGGVMVLGRKCVCPECPAPISSQIPMTTTLPLYQDKNMNDEEDLNQFTITHSRSVRSLSNGNTNDENNFTCPHFHQQPKSQQDCQYHCKFGGIFKHAHESNSPCNKCECYCGPNQMTAQQEPVKNCDMICSNEYILDIERAKNSGCQSKCICSKNMIYDYHLQDKTEIGENKLSNRICLTLEKHIKNSQHRLTQTVCDKECGKYGGSLVPYQVVTTNSETGQSEKQYCSHQATFCKCRESKDTTVSSQHSEDAEDSSMSTSSSCQQECGYSNVDYIESVFSEISNDSVLTSSFHKKYHCHCK
ncbi:hypothetical protein C9374_011042 [Naegleria lovaniensis]|uniref:Uncharacterized protein n=1 Tax=Naegleria lovaniensis TaxID=51637 RepID=A0AA88GA58_NAELO|nr:uncharacterized protein C9374_011042 [Naegleria lovaniensis]KAG2374205.1 hypothetical protein C9374_011042 [Naegleria lovaniensis]